MNSINLTKPFKRHPLVVKVALQIDFPLFVGLFVKTLQNVNVRLVQVK